MSHLNIAFDRYSSIGTVMHYMLVIRVRTLFVLVSSVVLRMSLLFPISK